MKRGYQSYRCNQCGYVWINNPKKSNPNIQEAYKEYVCGRRILAELKEKHSLSIPTLNKLFDNYSIDFEIPEPNLCSVNLLYDATFFGRDYGFVVFHDNEKVVYFEEIKTENIAVIKSGFKKLQSKGYKFKSFTIDGRRGVIQMLEQEFPNTPIQFCHFHQQRIIKRYITNNPKTECGKDIQLLMKKLNHLTEKEFVFELKQLEQNHKDFLLERNEKKQFMHKRIRSATRSLNNNLPYLFAYKNHPDLNIPNTTNKLESIFSHLKEKVKIHRGLRVDRKKKMIKFILSEQ